MRYRDGVKRRITTRVAMLAKLGLVAFIADLRGDGYLTLPAGLAG